MPTEPEETYIALMRAVSSSMASCELTHLPRTMIDVDLARRQHFGYERTLRELGCHIEKLPEEPELADSVFVEDTAIVLDELAVITRPGAQSRRAETPTIATALGAHRVLARIEPPATLDGGDVLRVDRTLYVGASARTNRVAIEQLRVILDPFGYHVLNIQVKNCLHLKSAVTRVGAGMLLANPRYVDSRRFNGMEIVEVDETEPLGANAVLIADTVVYPASHARTAARLRTHGISVRTIDLSEIEKAEGGVTCCSLIFARGDQSERERTRS